ncbi:two-component system regulatory protein YycI [Thermicanus aegyptius]|uniref:two-component system regulatory protein YycI n=1 Tax=Thermicanus aegyptius TaxID=94009 RepID=UPI00041500D8|nr:two-component system regulatory protein YycI [Thermicanus aegyptius]
MDWSRAKTILIFSFLLLDLFLGYFLWQQKKEQDSLGQVSQLEQESIKKTLEERRIAVPEDIPYDTPEMLYWTISPDSNKKIPVDPSQGKVEEGEEGVTVTFQSPHALPDPSQKRRFQEAIQKEFSLAGEYEYDPYLSTRGKMVYTQKIDGFSIFSSRLELLLTDRGLEGYHITYTKAEGKGAPRKMISAYSALSVLVENGLIRSGERVEEVKAGYYQERYDQELKLLVPVWRVVHTGGIHYVNGFIGTVVETKEE